MMPSNRLAQSPFLAPRPMPRIPLPNIKPEVKTPVINMPAVNLSFEDPEKEKERQAASQG